MQIKFKKQIDIELDRSDLLEAVQDLLAKNGQTITAAELEEVKFINSPQTGIRATLKITEESVSAEEVLNGNPTEVVSPKSASEFTAPESPASESNEPEAPGEIPAPTVADVAVEEAVARAFVEEEEEEVQPTHEATAAAPSADSLRSSLF